MSSCKEYVIRQQKKIETDNFSGRFSSINIQLLK